MTALVRVIRTLGLAIVVAWPGLGAAQELDPNNSDGDHGGFTLTPELDLGEDEQVIDLGFGRLEEVERRKVASGDGATLRALDKVSGSISDLEIRSGQTVAYGRLSVQLGECRYPKGNPSGDAYGYLVIRPADQQEPVFQGWMVASSPALNALDHPRYDVWILRCTNS